MAWLSWMAKKFTRGMTYQWKAKDLANAREYLYGVANIVIQRYNERLLKCRGSCGIGVPEQKIDIVKTRKMLCFEFFGHPGLHHTALCSLPLCNILSAGRQLLRSLHRVFPLFCVHIPFTCSSRRFFFLSCANWIHPGWFFPALILQARMRGVTSVLSPLVLMSFFWGRENVYRYAHFFFFWLTSSYIEDSNKMTVMHVLCASTWLLGSHGGSGSEARLSHHPHIAAHLLHEYQVDIRWISVPSRRFCGAKWVAKK